MIQFDRLESGQLNVNDPTASAMHSGVFKISKKIFSHR